MSYPKKIDKNVRLLQYTNASTEENFDAFLTHHVLVYILSGVKHIKVSNSHFCINSGELFLIPRGEYVMSEYITGKNGFQSMMLFFNQKVATNVLEGLNDRIPEICMKPKKKEAIKIISPNPAIGELFRSLEIYSKEEAMFLVEIARLKFMELIYLLLDSSYRNMILAFLRDAARYEIPSVSTVLDQHLYSPLTVEELAKLSGRSLSTFKREFTL